jgi:hypothetical protein
MLRKKEIGSVGNDANRAGLLHYSTEEKSAAAAVTII